MFRFSIRFDSVFFDKNSKELHAKGIVCFGAESDGCQGIPGVTMFKAKRGSDNIIYKRIEIGESSDVKDTLEGDGTFNFTVKIKPGESLFFYSPHFYLEEFKLDKLF